MIRNRKKGFVLLTTSLVSIFIIMLIGTYFHYTSSVTSLEFHKDLAKIRGFWAVYGAKELEDEPIYKYYSSSSNNLVYTIETQKKETTIPFIGTLKREYIWTIENTENSGIKNDMIHKRKLDVDVSDSNIIKSYLK